MDFIILSDCYTNGKVEFRETGGGEKMCFSRLKVVGKLGWEWDAVLSIVLPRLPAPVASSISMEISGFE